MSRTSDPRIDQGHAVDRHVGARVRQRRKAIGMNQAELALSLGLTFQQVQKYERGLNRISASKLWETARALEVSTGWFFEGYATEGEISPAANDVQVFLKTSDAIDLGEAYLKLASDRQRQCVLDLMKSMAGG